MPKFNLAPLPTDLEPQWSPLSERPVGQMNAGQAKEHGNQRIESAAGSVPLVGGVLKPLVQLANTLASPDTKVGMFTGPVNGVSKLGNAIGDLVQGKPVDVKDAWTISDQTSRQLNPFRIGTQGQYVTPSDEAGLALGEGIGAEVAGMATGATLINGVSKLARVQSALRALRATQQVKSLAVAAKVSPALRAGLNVGANVGEALVGTSLAAIYLDQEDGNLANLGDAIGLKLPGRVEPGENYLQSFGKSLMVEGIAAPLAVMGAGSLLAPVRKGLATGGLEWLDELADAELAPYMPKPVAGPALPAAGQTGAPQLPGYTPTGGALVPYDSAITRSLQEQTQIRQVAEQRQRLQQMGLVQQGEGGQLDLALGGAVDPQIRTQVRELQTQRGQLIKQAMESGGDVTEQLGKIDQQIGDLIQAGKAEDFMPGPRYYQPEMDMPDPRPELDTYLANLDELSDRQLREVHSRIYQADAEQRAMVEMQAVQAKVDMVQQQVVDIAAREDLTDIGRKRLLSKAEKELARMQAELEKIQNRQRVPESLVGDQLTMKLDQQLGLDLTDQIQLPPFQEVARGASEFGYQTPDDYRSALQGWNRDLLRKMASPEQSPEVAALVKARTGRRVWQAKKQDIIDALVELSERRGRYLPPEPEQMQLGLTTNPVGGDAPLLDQPADLSVPGMKEGMDADGNPILVPMDDYTGRGMDPEAREQLKAQILQRAIDNGEVQAPITPIPERPATTFNQASMLDELFADPTGQGLFSFATDVTPTYKAGGKGADDLIEELRLRYEYNLLDADAKRAHDQALMAAHGWDKLTWEEKKRLGILDRGFYTLQPFSDRFRDATPAAKSDLDAGAVPPRKPKVYRMGPDGQLIDEAAVPKPSPEQAKQAKQTKTAQAKAVKAEAKGKKQLLAAERDALLKQREELLRQSKGANC